MNIFFVDEHPEIAAQSLGDRHVVKMVLETAQILSTVIRQQFPDAVVYKSTHVKHPCVLWAGSSEGNFNWLINHGMALADEYTYRYGRVHKSLDTILLAAEYKLNFSLSEVTEPAQAMPAEFKRSDPVEAYRLYYAADKIATGIAQYNKNRPAPMWVNATLKFTGN